MTSSEGTSPGNWPLLALILATSVVSVAATGLSIDWKSAVAPALICLGLEAAALFYRSRRPDPRLAAILSNVAQLLAFTIMAMPLSYAAARAAAHGPAWDATFMRWDEALGIDWQACLAFVNARPGLSLVGTLAYGSVLFQISVATIALCFTHRLAECRHFIRCVILAALIAIAISELVPAMTVFMHLGLHQADYPNVPFIDDTHFLAVRDGSLRTISLAEGQGIIAFPSFHAALGVILMRAFWSVPWLRWPGLVLNLVMIAATPTHGGHYVVDVIAGIGVGLVAILVPDRAPAADRAVPAPRTQAA